MNLYKSEVDGHEPTDEEWAAIGSLRLAGYEVVRQRTYDALRQRVTLAEAEREWCRRDSEVFERWALREADMVSRLNGQLAAVVAMAASQGLTLDAIHAALGELGPVHAHWGDDSERACLDVGGISTWALEPEAVVTCKPCREALVEAGLGTAPATPKGTTGAGA